MSDALGDLVQWLEALPAVWVYVLILAVSYGENVVPPVPGDMLVVFGGYMAGLGLLDPVLVVLLATVGGSLGFMTMYVIGARLGHAVLDPDRLKWLPKGRIQVVRRHLQQWGFGLVLANRFLSGLRSVISLTVGLAHMEPGRTAFWCTLSSLIWTSLIVAGGWYLGENWQQVGSYIQTYGWALTGLVVAFIAWQIVRYRKQRTPNGFTDPL